MRASHRPGDPRWLGVLPVIGFAGIARPEKFYATLKSHGARVIETRSFPDHHRFTEREARALLKEAEARGAMLVTTDKDWVRLPEERDSPLGELQFRARPLPIAIRFADEAKLKDAAGGGAGEEVLTRTQGWDGSRGSA